MDSTTPCHDPVVLLITPGKPPGAHDHTAILAKAGFQVVHRTNEEASIPQVLSLEPRIIVAELADGGSDAMFNMVRRLKAHQIARHIPFIVYGVGLTADEIETTAHAGAMWLQLEPADGFKLLGAIRGVLGAP